MERLADVLYEARAAGLLIYADGDRLLVRGPKRLQALAQEVLRFKPEILALLAQELDETTWRATAMQGQVRPGKPIPVLVARVCQADPEQCLSCGDDLAPGERVRCRWCVRAAQQVIGLNEKERTA